VFALLYDPADVGDRVADVRTRMPSGRPPREASDKGGSFVVVVETVVDLEAPTNELLASVDSTHVDRGLEAVDVLPKASVANRADDSDGDGDGDASHDGTKAVGTRR